MNEASDKLKPVTVSTASGGSALVCQMERIAREGWCGQPATHKWHTKDGYILVCNRCILGVYLCGGNLTPIEAPNAGAETPRTKGVTRVAD